MTLEQGAGVVAAGPGQLGRLASLAAMGKRVFEVEAYLVLVSHGVGQQDRLITG